MPQLLRRWTIMTRRKANVIRWKTIIKIVCEELVKVPCPHGPDPRPHWPDPPYPLHVDIINGWPLIGHPFMTSTKNPVLIPLPPGHMGRTPLTPMWTSTRGRHAIHTALLKRPVQ